MVYEYIVSKKELYLNNDLFFVDIQRTEHVFFILTHLNIDEHLMHTQECFCIIREHCKNTSFITHLV